MEPTAFFDFPSRGKANFRWFLVFPRGGKPIFADFWFSPVEESRFSLISCFPSRGKAAFRRFLIFPRGRKLIFVRRTPTKRDFSYFPLIVGGTKPCFMRFSSIVPLRKLHFSVFRWLYPVSEQIFPKIDNLPPYLSYFSWKSMIVPRIWTNFPENW